MYSCMWASVSAGGDSHELQGRAAEGILLHHLNPVEGEHPATHAAHHAMRWQQYWCS